MTDILQRLMDNASELIRSGYYDRMPDRLAPGPCHGFSEALAVHPSFPIIAEVKLASPTVRVISHRDPSDLVQQYREGGAAAISVLTEPNSFRGSLDNLMFASASGLPSLMKDVIIDGCQVRAAKNFGASAVLLIEGAFAHKTADLERDSLIELSHSLGLEVLLEACDEHELRRSVGSGADLIGINQRDLRTMRIDPNKGEKLLREVRNERRPIVIMSGIGSKEQIESLRAAGASAVLVGTSAASSTDPRSFLSGLKVSR